MKLNNSEIFMTNNILLRTLILIMLSFVGNSFCIAKVLYKPTIEYLDNNEPKNFPNNNNLIINHSTGISNKDKIIIRGQVLDNDGIPISDAKILLWQVDDNGKYVYEPLKTKADKKLFYTNKSIKLNHKFRGAGTNFTNNKGEFLFITIFPYKLGYVNIRVIHNKFDVLQTKLYLTKKNFYSQCHKNYKQEHKFFIVMSGKNKYKHY